MFSLDCEQGGVLVQSLSVRLTRDVTMFNVWQERSQIINMWSVPLVTSSHWLYNFVCLFDSFALIIFYFIRTPCEPTESFRCFFPIPVFTEALKGFFSFLHFFPVKKSLNVFYCYSFNYLFPCVNPSDISFVSFQEKFLSLCFFFSQFHTLKKCLFLCHFARDFLFFPL